MPFIASSTYNAPFGFGNGHVQTVYPTLFRRVLPVTQRRERIETPDGDFLDLDWSEGSGDTSRLAVLSHGLEGASSQHYIQGMAAALRLRGWEILAWNYRGCSGEPNRLARTYHSGATEDLQAVLDHVFASGGFDRIALVGFSLGGNITLKYLGEAGSAADSRIRGAVAFSVPCDLASSAKKLAGFSQRIYMRRFRKTLERKIRGKLRSHPEVLAGARPGRMRDFRDIDEQFTAPLNGFASAEDYWERCSSRRVLKEIRVPALLVNAMDDPFLGAACFPREEAEANEYFSFEAPRQGGHMGFVPRDRAGEYWSETRAAEFLESIA